ncbi:MAG: LptA/OstA family protein [Thermodesulfovibrionales bacterium]|nr:LptA/OstA family protein [Thermodesulfovibrionales bacterium]
MSRQLFISSLLILFLLSTNVFSEEKAQQIKGPIIITSEMLTADNRTHTALFENSVVARTTDMTLHADRMLVYYNADTGNITKIEAEGGIKLIKGTRAITSKEATYCADGEKIIFIGEPRAVEGENVVTGRKITYLLNEDRFLVEGSKVFLRKQKGQ